MAKATLTLEERDELRAKTVKRLGFDGCIPEKTADAIRAFVAQHWHVQGEEFNGFRLTFYVVGKGSFRSIIDAETHLSKEYGDAPHKLATIFDRYKLTFVAN